MGTIEVIRADITTLEVDAIVNAANRMLAGGAGVDGAIHRAGGPSILAECRTHVERDGPLATGGAVATTAGDLMAKVVVHTVGPVWSEAGEAAPAQLRSCYRRSLEVAAERDCDSIAFPSISTGVYGYPVERAADVAMDVLRGHAQAGTRPRRIVMCCFSEEDRETYAAALGDLGGPPE